MRSRNVLEASLEFVERRLWGDGSPGAMVSYAQNGEDVLLCRALGTQATGFYIDAGANDPVAGSVTKAFYDRGWVGINIEPGQAFGRLARMRPRDTNLHLALSDQQGESTFYEFPESDGLSTLSAEVRSNQRLECVERTVPLTTLAEVCRRYVERTIDFLKIDVEGHEREVIAGGDWNRWRPRIAMVESPTNVRGDGPHCDWEPLLLGADYRFAAFDGINRYYVRSEDEDLLPCFRLPLNVLDNYVAYRHIQEYEGLGPLALSTARCVQKLLDLAGFWYPRRLARRS